MITKNNDLFRIIFQAYVTSPIQFRGRTACLTSCAQTYLSALDSLSSLTQGSGDQDGCVTVDGREEYETFVERSRAEERMLGALADCLNKFESLVLSWCNKVDVERADLLKQREIFSAAVCLHTSINESKNARVCTYM